MLRPEKRTNVLGIGIGIFALLTYPAAAGVLTPREPIVESNRYTIPVYLSGTEGGVTALDFRLDFDAAAFRPVSVEAGAAILSAGKLVNSNSPGPGAYRVVVMGLNQDPSPAGEVARLVLERIEPGGGAARFAVSDPTLALADGSKEQASGGEVAVRADPGNEAPGEEPDDETPEPATPEAPDEDDAPSDDTLSEAVTEQVMDGMLGALTGPAAAPSASAKTPGATRVSGEEDGEKLSIRNRRWSLPVAADSGVTVIAKARPDERAEGTMDSSESRITGKTGDPGSGNDMIPADVKTGEAAVQTAGGSLESIKTVESVGEAAGGLSPSGVVREPSAERGWARTTPVLGALAAAAGAIALLWLRLRRAARQPSVSPKRG